MTKELIKGRISSQKTVWCCSPCNAWEYITNAGDARRKGWKLTKDKGWLCPPCVKNSEER